ncbi:MAG TPA: sugar phosphate isomerase/epimerase family protein [Bryobacteraceae bacterium]|nr:sugar phosphate isomerase/epimerase family protein [Bryobacteraceae bacterium]
MKISRRSLLIGGVAVPLARGWARARGLKVGVTDWNLRLTGNVEAVETAARLRFDGVQVSLGRTPIDGKLPLDDTVVQQQYLTASKIHKIPIDGTCLDILHVNCLKNDKLGAKWVADAIPITKKLDTRVILLPFFGKCALKTPQEMDYVGDVLREIAPEAEKAGVILGLEDTISAEDNVRIMERSKSPAVLTYYDVGNSTQNGFEVVKEIRWLGKDRICQFHLKDNPHYLGEGKIDFPAVLKAIEDIGFHGFANLETDSPSKAVEDDMSKNLRYVRRLLA